MLWAKWRALCDGLIESFENENRQSQGLDKEGRGFFFRTEVKDSLSAPNFFRLHEYVTSLAIRFSNVQDSKFPTTASEVWCLHARESPKQKQFYFTSEIIWQYWKRWRIQTVWTYSHMHFILNSDHNMRVLCMATWLIKYRKENRDLLPDIYPKARKNWVSYIVTWKLDEKAIARQRQVNIRREQ
jgi:hypothetical protein